MNKEISLEFSGEGWIDVSVAIYSDMVHWPGDPGVKIERSQDLDKGDSHTISKLTLGSHTGTHVDAPSHFFGNGLTISDVNPETLLGNARVIQIKDAESIKAEELESYKIQKGERILFKTLNSSLWQQDSFSEEFVFITSEAASYLIECGIKVIGVDYLSVGGYKKDGGKVHKIFLQSGIWLIEGLDLSSVEPGMYQFICLPLKIRNGDGAPARVLLKPI